MRSEPPRDLETPVGVVDPDRVRRNAERVAAYGLEHGLAWRPHIKTHKCVRVAQIQLQAGASGLTVATLREAEVMSEVCADLLLAYPPIGPAKLARLTALPSRVRIAVALDSEAALVSLADAADAAGREVGVLIEVDVGLRRTGVASPEEAVALARIADRLDGVRYDGLMYYPGHIRTRRENQGPSLEALDRTVAGVLAALDAAGLPPGVVSGGSTPTLWSSHRTRGLTEIRAGSCIFHDRESVEAGVVDRDDVAYTVLTTVVSTAVSGQAVVDAGSKALSKEVRAGDGGFGVLLDHPEVPVSALSEEHGVLDLARTSWRPRIGDRVRVVPNHVCVSVNLQEHLVALGDGEPEVWPLEARGRGPWRAAAAAPA